MMNEDQNLWLSEVAQTILEVHENYMKQAKARGISKELFDKALKFKLEPEDAELQK